MDFNGKDVGVRLVKKTQSLICGGIKETKNANSKPLSIRVLQPLLVFAVIFIREDWKKAKWTCLCAWRSRPVKSRCAGQKAAFNGRIYWDYEIIFLKEDATTDPLLAPFKQGFQMC